MYAMPPHNSPRSMSHMTCHMYTLLLICRPDKPLSQPTFISSVTLIPPSSSPFICSPTSPHNGSLSRISCLRDNLSPFQTHRQEVVPILLPITGIYFSHVLKCSARFFEYIFHTSKEHSDRTQNIRLGERRCLIRKSLVLIL